LEDKTFELITKMYGEFTSRFNEMEIRFDKIETDIQGLKKDVLRIENEHGKKLEALFDGYQQTYEKLDVIEQKLDDLSEKVDRHDIRIQVIEGGRK
jgi:predicted RNase H-like nuclease (RuvC/YqgF family)